MQNLGLAVAAIIGGILWVIGATVAVGGWEAGGIPETILICIGLIPLVGGAMHIYQEWTDRPDAP